MQQQEILTLSILLVIIIALILYLVKITKQIDKRKRQLEEVNLMIDNIKIEDKGTDIDKLVNIIKEDKQ